MYEGKIGRTSHEKNKEHIKKIAAAILAAALMMTSTSATVLLNPTAAYAETVPDNGQNENLSEVSEGDSMNNNDGEVDENRGTIKNNSPSGSVDDNYGEITNNYGSVNDNMAAQSEGGHDGWVNNNYGTITTNNGGVGQNKTENSFTGKIETNNGVVVNNNAGFRYWDGDVQDDGNGIRVNNGEVWTNNDYGYIDDNQGAVNTNKGYINKNAGNDPTITDVGYITKGVHENEGTINENSGLVEINYSAGTVTNNNGKVTTNNGTVTNNLRDADLGTGNIVTNNGLVENNHGVIENNVGNEVGTDGYTAVKGVKFNLGDGEITTNSGYVRQNYGTIDINDTTGYVNTNYDGNRTDSHTAIIKVNKGRVNLNSETVTLNTGVINYNEGTVTNNFGNVGCCGEYQDGSGYHPITSYIVNQYDGTLTAVAAQGTERSDTVITNFFGGTIQGDGFIVVNNFSDQDIGNSETSQYRSVSFVADEVSTRFSTDYGTGFTDKTLMNPDGTNGTTKYYINVTGGNGSGTITIVAEDGYEVKQSGQASVTGFNYTLTKQGYNYVLNITGYNGNSIELSPRMFGLVVEAIQQTNPTPAPSPNPDPDPSPSQNTETDPDPADPAIMAVPVNPFGTIGLANTMDQTAITAVAANEAAIIAEINAMSASGGVVSVPNLAQTGLSASVVAALAAKNDVPINLTYTVGGITYMLVIPAGFNLLTLLNAYGGIDFASLFVAFGASAVG